MELVTDLDEFRKLNAELSTPAPVFDLVLDDRSFVPGAVAVGDKALGVIVGGHTGFLAFADVPEVGARRVRYVLRVSGIYAWPLVGWWLRRCRANRAGASRTRPSWIPAL